MSEGPANMRQSFTAAGERIQEIIDVAERVAGEIQADAQRQAEEYLARRRAEADRLAEQRLSELTEVRASLLSSVADIQTKVATLLAALDTALGQVERSNTLTASPAPDTQAPAADLPPLESPAPAVRPTTSREPEGEAQGAPTDHDRAEILARARAAGPEDSSAALLRATQLLVAGRDRAEIEATLRSEFALGDPAPLVDQILGRAS